MTEELKADFTKALPGGAIDDATYEAVETALDQADAPIHSGSRWLTLPERVTALAASRDAADQDAHELTKALTGLVGGGSEMFVQKRGRFLANIRYCVERIRDRDQRNHRTIVDETLRAKAAEARCAVLKQALKSAVDAMDTAAKATGASYLTYEVGVARAALERQP